jgi:hypothetical protein
MKLSQICSEPQLVEVKLDDKDIVKQYGEPLVFYTYDRQPMDVFMRLANIDGKNTGELISIVKTLILDDEGKQILNDKNMLPTGVLMKAIAKVTEQLGK